MKERKIVVHLYGGIGNQLFQYTFGEYIRNKYHEEVFYDISSFGVLETFRDLQIDSIVKDIPVFKTGKLFFSRHIRFARRLFRLIFRLMPGNVYFENRFDETIFSRKNWKLVYFDGYWQDKIYPLWVKENVIDLYQPMESIPEVLKPYVDYINNNNVTSIHVRRGDYLNASNINMFGVCSLDYFKEGTRIISEKVPNAKFLIFTDDIQWVKQNMKLQNEFRVVDNDPIKPFWYIYLMSLCDNNIISNSSFSWWGAFLNNNIEKWVIAPKNWYKERSNPKMYLDNYIII